MKTFTHTLKITIIVAVVLTMAILGACAKKSGEINAATLASDLKAKSVFAVEPYDITKEQMAMRLGLKASDIDECYAAVPSSAEEAADEYAVIKATDEDAAKRVEAAIKQMVEGLKGQYALYASQEVPKLENVIIETHGVYVIYVCGKDYSAAKDVIKSHVK